MFANRVFELVEAAAAREPLGLLPRNASDRVEVSVVVKKRCFSGRGDSRDEKVERLRRPSVLAASGKRVLRSSCERDRVLIERELVQET